MDETAILPRKIWRFGLWRQQNCRQTLYDVIKSTVDCHDDTHEYIAGFTTDLDTKRLKDVILEYFSIPV